MIKYNTKKIKDTLKHIRELAQSHPSEFRNLSREEVINKMRKTRKKLWKNKIASGS